LIPGIGSRPRQGGFPGPLFPAHLPGRDRRRNSILNPAKGRLIRHGKIITGFANEEYPDDAVRSYFDNLSIFLNSPADFKSKIEKIFPYLDNYESSLTILDKKLLVYVLEEERIKSYLNNQLEMIDMLLDHYIPENNTLMLSRFNLQGGLVDGVPDVTTHVDGPYPVKSIHA
jgi:hypothetical protein